MERRGDRIPVFLNASAGRISRNVAELEAALGGVEVVAVPPAALQAAIRRAIADGASTVGVAGGDGTLHAAAAVLAGTPVALAPVPTGTLNHFARRVGIHSLEDAAAALRDGTVITVPVGTAGDTVFLNTLTFGEYSRIVRIREHHRRRLGKWPAAAVAFTTALFTLRRMRLTLTLDDEVITRRTPFVWIGVGWGSFPRVHEALERRSRPDLEVAVLRSASAAAGLAFLVRLGVRMATRQGPVRDRALDVVHARELTIDSGHRIDVTADGEVFRLQPPVQVGIRDDGLRVLAGPRRPSAGPVARP